MGDSTVVLVGTLDTKGAEYDYLRDRLKLHEHNRDINDPQFALAMARKPAELVGAGRS